MLPTTLALYAACAVAAVAAAGAGWQTVRLANAQTELATERQNAATAALAYADNARKVEATWRGKVANAQAARQAEVDASDRTANAARRSADGVLNDAAAFGACDPGGSFAACSELAATLRDLLAEALRADRESTRAAEKHGTDLRAVLAGWPAAVSAAASAPKDEP